MREASVSDRVGNVLGAFVIAAAERVHSSVVQATGRPGSDTAALVILTTVLSGVSQELLGQVVGLTQPGAARAVERLVRAGLVERHPGPDRRTHAVVPTPAGLRAARDALDARSAATAALLAPLDQAEREQLLALLGKLVTGMTGSPMGAIRICRLCDPDTCGHDTGHCPVTLAAEAFQNGP